MIADKLACVSLDYFLTLFSTNSDFATSGLIIPLTIEKGKTIEKVKYYPQDREGYYQNISSKSGQKRLLQ